MNSLASSPLFKHIALTIYAVDIPAHSHFILRFEAFIKT